MTRTWAVAGFQSEAAVTVTVADASQTVVADWWGSADGALTFSCPASGSYPYAVAQNGQTVWTGTLTCSTGLRSDDTAYLEAESSNGLSGRPPS